MYQVTVFISRSSISLGFPPLPEKLLPVPAILQLVILLTLVYESAIGIFGDSSEGASFYLVFWLICIEGLCGGLALYVIILHFLHVLILTLSVLIRSVNVYYRINLEKSDSSDPDIAKQEKEFKIGSVGVPDSIGIILAVLLSMPLELSLCATQVRRGKELCRSL